MSEVERWATADEPPRAGGSYLLVLRVAAPAACMIGRVGEVRLDPGWYV